MGWAILRIAWENEHGGERENDGDVLILQMVEERNGGGMERNLVSLRNSVSSWQSGH